MATFGGTANDVPNNGPINNFYNPEVCSNFHFKQNIDCMPEQRHLVQDFSAATPAAPYPPRNPYSGYETGLTPSCPQWVEYKWSSDNRPTHRVNDQPTNKIQESFQTYPYPERFAGAENSSSSSIPPLPLRFSVSKENFPRNSEQHSVSLGGSLSQLHHPWPGFKGAPDSQGQQNIYDLQYGSMPHLYSRPPPVSPYQHHPLQPPSPQFYSTESDSVSEGPYMKNYRSLKVSPSLYYSQSLMSHPNALPLSYKPSVEYPETADWTKKNDGSKASTEANGERKQQPKILANNARKIVYGLKPLPPPPLPPPQMTSKEKDDPHPNPQSTTDSQIQPKITSPDTIGPSGAPHMPGPSGAPHMPGPNGAPHMPGPSGAPYMLGPNGAPYMPGPNAAPHMPGPNGAPYMLGPNGAPYMLGPNGAPYMPGPSGVLGEVTCPATTSACVVDDSTDATGLNSVADVAPATTKAADAEEGNSVKEVLPMNFTRAKVLSCLVVVFCGGLLWGVLAFILAAEGQTSYRRGERKKALKLKQMSYVMSFIGIGCGLIGGITAGVLFGVYRM